MRRTGVIALTTDQLPDGTPVPPGTVAEFSRRYGLELVRFAYLLCGDRHRAEDLVQDVLLALYRRHGGALPMDNPVAYARRAVVNTNISWSRRATNRELTIDKFSDGPAGDDTDPAERDALWQALRRLPLRQRTVLVLRYYADATDDDIAASLRCRRGTVRSLASRGLAVLREDRTLITEDGA